MIIGLQITAIVFSLIMIYFAVLNYRRGEINGIEIFSWLLIWSVTIFAISFPEILRTFARTFSITRLFDLLVVGGFILVISMVTRAYIVTRRMERKLNEFIDKDAKKSGQELKNKTTSRK